MSQVSGDDSVCVEPFVVFSHILQIGPHSWNGSSVKQCLRVHGPNAGMSPSLQ